MVVERLSVFDIFKIGVGPSSSHTLGPWNAARMFLSALQTKTDLNNVESVFVQLYGSLAKTGRGHGTDVAVLLGLSGYDPITIDTSKISELISSIHQDKVLHLDGKHCITFDPVNDIFFHSSQSLPFHPNGMTIIANLGKYGQVSESYYSIGGGFIQTEGEKKDVTELIKLKYPIDYASDLVNYCGTTGLSIPKLVLENEKHWKSESAVRKDLMNIYQVMMECVYHGCHSEGVLPGGLNVKRRAGELNNAFLKGREYSNFSSWLELIRAGGNDFQYILSWVSCFALAVNEENASFARVVTAPTNGAAGVIPAVLLYFVAFCNGNQENKIIDFLLTAGEVGAIFKKGSTISAAMGGCQAEIGVSSAMAAAGLTEVLGGTYRQCLMAAEIAMEHHLGLTCDPVGGLVQIPCIERNAMGAIKAITASHLALKSDPESAKVSLDVVIQTMWETAKDMNSKYKETSEGGLAVNIPISLSEC